MSASADSGHRLVLAAVAQLILARSATVSFSQKKYREIYTYPIGRDR